MWKLWVKAVKAVKAVDAEENAKFLSKLKKVGLGTVSSASS